VEVYSPPLQAGASQSIGREERTMRRMWTDSGRCWGIVLAGLALLGGMLPTTVALGQTFDLTATIPRNGATLNISTGEVTLTVNVTCSEDAIIEFAECFADQEFGRTNAEASGSTGGQTCTAGEITPITVTLETDFGILKVGATSVGCTVCGFTATDDFACDEAGATANLKRTR
jgi:hypothetical protein